MATATAEQESALPFYKNDDVFSEDNMLVPFNRPHMTGKELQYIAEAHRNGRLAGDGPFTKKCQTWLEKTTLCHKALLTHSCTAALEMAAILLNIQPGDEVVLPSFTFVSTANAFVLRGGVPVFVDVRPDTLNLDEKLIEQAITPRTRAIVPVHYAGVSCEMDSIMAIGRAHGLKVIEDAAQGIISSYKGRALGSIGDLGAFSFHETKNVIAGEGGALLINDPEFSHRAEIMREKGTDRSRFFRGEVDKYTWQDVGSSFLPGELVAAFLWAQLEEAQRITARRLDIWNRYATLLNPLEEAGMIRLPIVPPETRHNAHLFYVLLDSRETRQQVLAEFMKQQIHAVFHYVPLHSSPGGRRYGRVGSSMPVTDDLSERLIRLPLWFDITEETQSRIVSVLARVLEKKVSQTLPIVPDLLLDQVVSDDPLSFS